MKIRIKTVLLLFAIGYANIVFAQNNLVANPNFNEIESQAKSADYPKNWEKISGNAKMVIPRLKDNGKYRTFALGGLKV